MISLELILGGARSGKSRHALERGREPGIFPKIFLATAHPGDEEMKSRIERHQNEREKSWKTFEEPYYLSKALEQSAVEEKGLVLVDCTTLWISNLLCGIGGKALSPDEIQGEFKALFGLLPRLKGRLILVSNEVGLGIVPDNQLSRNFRDLQGEFNQGFAAIAGQVILMTAGIAQKIK